ncbi:MAG: PIN domain-containing protein [Nitrospirae bacterium]|nr:PIN domain-containing protein [Nitrospirota bacterium]
MTEQLKKLPDTNTILRYLLKDDIKLYEESSKFFEKVRVGNEKIIILESVLVECVYVLTKFYNVPRAEASERLKELFHYKGMQNNDKKELIEALTMFANKNIDIVDCILCEKAKSYNMSLFSFDEDVKKCR